MYVRMLKTPRLILLIMSCFHLMPITLINAQLKMAAKDLIGILNGLRMVLTSGCVSATTEAKHILNNSSLQPIVGSLCQTCCHYWMQDTESDIPDFSAFDESALGGSNWSGWKTKNYQPDTEILETNSKTHYINTTSDSKFNKSDVMKSINSNRTRKLHTWCYRRYHTNADSSVRSPIGSKEITNENSEKVKYHRKRNQQVFEI